VYAVVVTYNGAAYINDCLSSLAESAHPVTIIVVDNGSTDETLKLVEHSQRVICLPQDQNLGFGLANNIGISRALSEEAEYVFLLNQDAKVRSDTIGQLVEQAQHHRQYGILSPLHLNGDGIEFDTLFLTWLVQGAPRIFSDFYLGSVQPIYPVGFVNAAIWLVTRDCLERIGGFDPIFHMYGEDLDYCRRAQYHGLKVGIVPSATARHSRGQTSRSYTSDWDRRRSNLARLSNRARNRNILRLKDPSKSLVRECAAVSIDFVRDVLQDIVAFNPHGCTVSTWGFLSALLSLPRIWKHRRISISERAHWLQHD
jgi:GT2 family glycosyltransferase